MPFGLKSAPSTFQILMNKVLIGLQGVELQSYIDDIIIYSSDLKDHVRKFRLLMERLKKAKLELQIDKCKFLQHRICDLGHVLSEKGLEVDPKKVDAIKRCPIPRTVFQVREFLGVCTYNNRHIQNFTKMIKPLTRLLQKDVTPKWDENAHAAFDVLKATLCNAPCLTFPDFSKPFIITCDASNYALGSILSQGELGKDKPAAYASRMVRGAKINYTIYESLAIIFSVKKFQHYIFNPLVPKRKFLETHMAKPQESKKMDGNFSAKGKI